MQIYPREKCLKFGFCNENWKKRAVGFVICIKIKRLLCRSDDSLILVRCWFYRTIYVRFIRKNYRIDKSQCIDRANVFDL